MSDSQKTRLIKYGAAFGVCAIVAGVYIATHQADMNTTAGLYRVLCDAFTVPGIMSILLGALFAVANEGAFHGVGYAVSMAVKALIPGGRAEMESYGDYLERKDRRKMTGFGFLFIVGGVFMAVALVFLVLFNQNYQ